MEKQFKVEMGFVQQRLPWLVAAAMFVLYLVTASSSATVGGLSALAQAAGWDWNPTVAQPLHALLTLPVRWLPSGIQLFVLNLTAAFFGAAAVWLIARSVALLPHDRTRDQRAFERSDYSMLTSGTAWVPPLFAALVCGFQLTFWENAIAATGEALNLAIFAYLIRCLLEYRLDENESWLKRFAFVYGAGVTNNYALIGFFPAFLVALVWIKWATFFKWNFLLRMLAWGGAGLLVYLVLPVAGSLSSDYGFWELLRSNWSFQKSQLLGMPRLNVILMSLTSVLPILFIGIRWPASFGDISAAGNALTNLMMHVIHAVFLVACVYVAFDPQFSPRNLGFGIYRFLPFYYLGALTAGYCAGYMLLVFGSKPAPKQTWPQRSPVRVILGPVIYWVVLAAALAVPVGLAVRNAPKVWSSGGNALSSMAAATAKSLPEKGGLVLCDDFARLLAVQLELHKLGRQKNFMLVDGSRLGSIAYQRYLKKRHANRWPNIQLQGLPSTALLDSGTQIRLLLELAKANDLYYLHPSFGAFFEAFHAKPAGLYLQLQSYPTNSISSPPLTAAEVKAVDATWSRVKTEELDPLLKKLAPINAKLIASKFADRSQSLEHYGGMSYSRAVNDFGVAALRAGDSAVARRAFDLAMQLNAANGLALLNLDYLRHLEAGRRGLMPPSDEVARRLAPYGGSWEAMLTANGPTIEPGGCYLVAEIFDKGNLPRQSAEWLERSALYDPTNFVTRLALINGCIKIGMADRAIEMIEQWRKQPPSPMRPDDQLELVRSEAWALALKKNLPASERLLTDAQEKNPRNPMPFAAAMQIYLATRQPSNALAVLERQMKVQPENTDALVNYAALLMQFNNLKGAITYLDRALALRPNDASALQNRAIACLNSTPPRLDDALRDYLALQAIAPRDSYYIPFGLGEVYRLKKNKKEALRYYNQYLKIAPQNLPERRVVLDRIKQVEASGQ